MIAEEEMKRRERNEGGDIEMKNVEQQQEGDGNAEEFYTEGTDRLRLLRMDIAESSLKRSFARLREERRMLGAAGGNEEMCAREGQSMKRLRSCTLELSAIGDKRPLSCITCINGVGGKDHVATGAFGGKISVFSMNGAKAGSISAHDARISNLTWANGMLQSAGADGVAKIFRAEQGIDAGIVLNNVATLRGHTARVGDIRALPYHEHVRLTGGYDGDVIVWNDETEVLRQPTGHSSVHRIAPHPDGSMFATAGLEGGVRLWDMRSGRAVMTLTRAHAREVTGLDWMPSGTELVSSGGDGCVRVWDMRKRRCSRSIAAHSGVVTSVKVGWQGDVVVSCGFDGAIKMWGSRRGWGMVMSFSGGSKAFDIATVERGVGGIVGAFYDCTWKRWAPFE